jgi:enoyl-CoA hydratase/carnithine racemase
MNLQHWKIDTDQDQIAWRILYRKDADTNRLNIEVFDELEILIDTIEKNNLRGIIATSEKSNGFIAGIDAK